MGCLGVLPYEKKTICVVVVQVCTVLHAVCWRVSPSAMFLETQLHTMLTRAQLSRMCPPGRSHPKSKRTRCPPYSSNRPKDVACLLPEFSRQLVGLRDKTRSVVLLLDGHLVSQLQFLWVKMPPVKAEETGLSLITRSPVRFNTKSFPLGC